MDTHADPTQELPSRRHPVLLAGFLLVGGVALLGLILVGVVAFYGFDEKTIGLFNIFYVLYTQFEPTQLVLALLVLPVFYLALTRPSLDVPGGEILENLLRRRWTLLTVAVLVLVIAWIGRLGVYREVAFSQDEFTMDFQAQVFATGQLEAPVPPQWQPFGKAMAPIFITYDVEDGTWFGSYLPTYSMLLALFHLLHIDALFNPLLAAFVLLMLAAVVRQIFPERPMAPVLAALLLATSPQFLVIAMSGYTMTAHLLFNLLWLYLYLKNSRAALIALPFVGCFAMGLHAFVPHALFAIPFLLRMVADRRWELSAYVASVYLASSALWIYWLQVVNPTIGPVTAARFGVPGWQQMLSQGMSLALVVTWNSAAFLVLAVVGLLHLRRKDHVLFDLAWSCAFTFGLYFFFFHDQGHGWGNRYIHPVLGNLAILAVAGWLQLEKRLDRRVIFGFVGTALLWTLVIQLPLRLNQVRTFTEPFNTAQEFLGDLDAPVVVIPTQMIWYGQDLVRNGPFLDGERPVIFFLERLNQRQVEELAVIGEIRVISTEELASLGLTPVTIPGPFRPGQP